MNEFTVRPTLFLGPIYQTIDAGRLRAANRETFPFFNAVDADLTPTSTAAVDVQFVTFYIFGVIPFAAPPSAKVGGGRCMLCFFSYFHLSINFPSRPHRLASWQFFFFYIRFM